MKKTIMAIGLAGLFASSGAIAKSGAYIGGSLGYGSIDTPPMNISSYTFSNYFEDDKGGTAWGIHTGYLFGESAFQYGAELGYSQYGKSKYTASTPVSSLNYKYTGYSFDLLAVTKYNFQSNFNLFAKAGVARATQELKVAQTANSDQKNTKHEILPKIAFGIGFNLTESWELNIEYSHLFGSDPDAISNGKTISQMNNEVASADTLTLGVNYKF
ncbi:outer membrane protein [Dongshaea marina]|uniref:outer membrane protein n=1 Tax=Dongshaea marina TaxID=2047966 RepID=UPI00131F0B6A|nr:outer membrane beta-barrel protein [Dongshaea marina]